MLTGDPHRNNDLITLAWFVGVPLTLGGLAGMSTQKQILTWWPKLRKPSWQPPAFLFGPIWSIMYVLTGISAWMVWTHGGWEAQRGALVLWAFQLVLNILWNPIFFLTHNMELALVDIAALWAMLMWTVTVFHQIEPLAAAINIPYLLWVSFATVLNYVFIKLNPPQTRRRAD